MVLCDSPHSLTEISLAVGKIAAIREHMTLVNSKPFLWAELIGFMLGVPLLMRFVLPPMAILPMVWLMAILCHFISDAANGWVRENWWGWGAITRVQLRPILKRFALCALLLTGFTYALDPALLFSFAREKPLFWLVVMVMYPLISVFAQEIIFRRYMFVRYKTLLSPMVLIIVSGVGFGFAHIVFGNWLAPLLCVIGGVMFAQTYARTGSLALVCLEHALYGDFVFTIGLGKYFYHGVVH